MVVKERERREVGDGRGEYNNEIKKKSPKVFKNGRVLDQIRHLRKQREKEEEKKKRKT